MRQHTKREKLFFSLNSGKFTLELSLSRKAAIELSVVNNTFTQGIIRSVPGRITHYPPAILMVLL